LLQNLIGVLLVLNCLIIILLLVVLRRSPSVVYLESRIREFEGSQNRLERYLREEIARNREENAVYFRLEREELSRSFTELNTSHLRQMGEMAALQNRQLELFGNQLSQLAMNNEQRLENMRQTIEERLTVLQNDNNIKLEQMRSTVDERLHSTLEVRLGESFKLVSDRLEMVNKGLGEMQALATGVGDLKKVLTNVKSRGIWGEVQLGNILEQVLAPEQYATNVSTKKGSTARVEYAVRLPGQGNEGEVVWLPIDAKFPLEDYLRLVDANENGDQAAAEEAAKQLEYRIRTEAREIYEKYLDPPNTTDFAIMFLPTESLYAEVARRPGLTEEIQRSFRVNITGPSTMAAFLNSLSMGFRTLAIQQRSSEVWTLLRAVKTEFSKFGQALDRTQKKIQEASSTIEKAAGKSRRIERKLKGIEQLPSYQVADVLEGIPEVLEEADS
jgi:DNA recombination protein RmuC